MILAQLSSGNADFADVCFLLAAIFAAVATIVTLLRGPLEGALLPAAVALISLGWYVL